MKHGTDIKLLDLGTGSGIQSKTALKAGVKKKNILASDINPEALKKLKPKFRTIKSDLFDKIKTKDKFDLIVFNPPYLPESKYDKEKDTKSGEKKEK